MCEQRREQGLALWRRFQVCAVIFCWFLLPMIEDGILLRTHGGDSLQVILDDDDKDGD